MTPRPSIEERLLGPWNGSANSYGGGLGLDWAPFVLIAIVNRLDLREAACFGRAGELRYVYGTLDPTTGDPLDMTLIVEIPYPATRVPRAWAQKWLALSRLPFGESFNEELERLTAAIRRDADPFAVRVRTNEAAFGVSPRDWELREFRVTTTEEGARLVSKTLETTPALETPVEVLAPAIRDATADILGGKLRLPPSLQAGAAPVPAAGFRWEVDGIDHELERAFSVGTCNGCHGGDTASLPFQHIALAYSATDSSTGARLSRFLYDPGPGADDLDRRTSDLRRLIHAQCTDDGSPYPGAPPTEHRPPSGPPSAGSVEGWRAGH